jgi:two-component system, NarL family, nitrate/nitrite response regulator NarL
VISEGNSDRPSAPTRVLILSDVRLYRDVLPAALADRAAIGSCEAVSTVSELLHRVFADTPTIVLVDMSRSGGPEAVRALVDRSPGVRILAFAVDECEADIIACAEAGVAGFVPRSASLQDLREAIDRVTRDELLCSPRTAASLFRRVARVASERPPTEQAGSHLSVREREIVALVDAGLSNKQIAARLNIEVTTVKNHVHRILEKLHVCRRGEAAARLRRAREHAVD